MLKGFFYTPRYSFWDMIPLAIIGAAIRHDDWVIAGVVTVIAIATNAVIWSHYENK